MYGGEPRETARLGVRGIVRTKLGGNEVRAVCLLLQARRRVVCLIRGDLKREPQVTAGSRWSKERKPPSGWEFCWSFPQCRTVPRHEAKHLRGEGVEEWAQACFRVPMVLPWRRSSTRAPLRRVRSARTPSSARERPLRAGHLSANRQRQSQRVCLDAYPPSGQL